jgi:hypothetical protein
MGASSRSLVSAVFFSIMAWSIVAAPPAADAADTPAICHFELHDTADPGFWTAEPTQGTLTSTAGAIICTGIVGGRPVLAEPGTLSWRMSYGGDGVLDESNCVYGRAAGSWDASLPMADGTSMSLTGPVEIVWNAVVAWTVGGRLGQHAVQGIGESTSDPERDPLVEPNVSCFTTPSLYSIERGQMIIG